ncbi:MAG: hypothetical protein JWL84_3177 [Rhodospirillales bacterium]|jgi:hypothetical protein|nr:hypothetical protein [Rhodospirillales bacterium]
MAILEDMLGGEMLAEAGIGAGILMLAPALLVRVTRPAAKALIKSAIIVYRGAADVINEASAARADEPLPQEATSRVPAQKATAGNKPRIPSARRGAVDRAAARKPPRRAKKNP